VRHFVYPETARRRGWEGEVVPRFSVVPPGNIEHIQLARSSGYYVIDQATLRALERAELSDLKALSRSFEMQLPIIYRLRGC
jgi:protein TonB